MTALETNLEEVVEQSEEKVVHDYHDYANEVERVDEIAADQRYPEEPTANRGEENFPVKLHYMLTELENDGMDDIVSWQPHGRCFLVHKQQRFVEQVLPLWFRQTKFPSFQRQLNLYGFKRLTTGRDKGAYYHELFLRSKRFLSYRIQRIKIKGKGARKPSSPETEPNFYHAPCLPPTKAHSKNNPWMPPVCNSLPLGMGIDPSMGGSVSRQQLRAFPAHAASFQNQQATHLPPLLDMIRLQEFQARAHLQQLQSTSVPMYMMPICPDMHMLPNFQQQNIPSTGYGYQDGLTVVNLSQSNPDPTAFGPPGLWRGA